MRTVTRPSFLGRHSRLGAPLGVLAVAAVGCLAVAAGDPTTPGGPLPLCPTKALLGIDCPGCGGLRMVYSLLHGRLMDALHYNAVALVLLPLLAWAWVAWLRSRYTGRPMRTWLQWRLTPAVVLVVTGVWFVIRNLPFGPFNGLYV
ncbi:DUF2752 domain-containing protein [Pseudonocardiaceae bacterium YIM PH 21723]|nr:DUF2752 domain-containing protein [Pseudonocardiaceae bacterium YIM PH 21723]